MGILSQIQTMLVLAVEEMPKGNIIAFDKQTLVTLIFQLINTVILVVVLTMILYKPVKKFLDDRRQAIIDDIDSAKATKAEAAELKVKYEKQLKDVEAEKEEILASAHQKALERSDYIIKEAKEEADHIYLANMAEVKEKTQAAQEEIKRQLIELSVLIAGKFVEDNIDEKIHNKYIDEALDDWEEGLWLD